MEGGPLKGAEPNEQTAFLERAVDVANIQRLRKPPIREALIDLQLADCDISAEQLDSVANALRREGWTKKELIATEAEFGPVGEGPDATLGLRSQIRAFDGYAIIDPTESVILQVRHDRITASHVGAYREWGDLVADASRALTVNRPGFSGGCFH